MPTRKNPQLSQFVGPRIAEAIKSKGRERSDVAKQLGMHPKSLTAILNGKRATSFEVIEALSGMLDVPPAQFFPGYPVAEHLSDTDLLFDSIVNDMKQLSPEYLDTLKLISEAMRKRLEKGK